MTRNVLGSKRLAPKVFSAVQGLETYSTAFHLDWRAADGAPRSVQLTSGMYAHLRGPYNRRNVYGAVLAFGPVMSTNPATAPMFRSVAICRAVSIAGSSPHWRGNTFLI